MKRMTWISIAAALLLVANVALAQSLADAAQAARKNKAQQTSTHRFFDNDNLPKDDHVSVVGQASTDPNAAAQTGDNSGQPQPAADASAANPAPAEEKDPKKIAEDRQKANDEWQQKIDAAKKNIESLSHELDITEREYRLRAVAMYSDAGNRLRNSATWDKEDADFKQQIETKQKALNDAKQQLENLQEAARKAGVPSNLRGE